MSHKGYTLGCRQLAASLLLLGVSSAALVHAQDTDDIAALLEQSVVSGASKTAETAGDAPATTHVITSDQIRRHGIRTLAEAIDYLGRGLMTQDPLHAVEIGGRGVLLAGDFGIHVLLVVDGHALNEAWGGASYYEQGAGIPIELVDHIELVLGPGSVLYGSSAMLGVVHVVTKRAKDYDGVHAILELGASPAQGKGGRFSSVSPKYLGTFERPAIGWGGTLRLFGKPVELTAQAEYYHHHGASFEWGPQPALNPDGSPMSFGPKSPPGVWGGRTTSAYSTDVPTFYAKLQAGDLSMNVRATQYRRVTPYSNPLYFPDFDDPNSFERDRWLTLEAQYLLTLSTGVALTLRAYADTYDYLYRVPLSDPAACTVPNPGPCVKDYIGKATWGGWEPRFHLDWFRNGSFTTLLGADVRVRRIDASSEERDLASDALLGSSNVFGVTQLAVGAYLQQRWSPIAALHFNAGARYDYDPRGGGALSPRVAIVWGPWVGGALKLILADAFRSPNTYESEFRPDQNLKPETVRSLEATTEQQFGRHRVAFGVFRNWWRDMISAQTRADGEPFYANAAQIKNYGFDAVFEGTMGDFGYGLGATEAFTRTQTPAGEFPLPVAPSLFGNARISWDAPGVLPTSALALRFVGSRLADRGLDGGFLVTPRTPPEVGFRLALSDSFWKESSWSWRATGDFVTSSNSPYVVGPTQYVDPGDPTPAELAPVNRLTVFVTLRYEASPTP